MPIRKTTYVGDAASNPLATAVPPTATRMMRRSPYRSASKPLGNCARAYASHMPVSANPMALFETAKASPTAGTTGLIARRAAIVAKNASVHAPSTAPSYDHSFTAQWGPRKGIAEPLGRRYGTRRGWFASNCEESSPALALRKGFSGPSLFLTIPFGMGLPVVQADSDGR